MAVRRHIVRGCGPGQNPAYRPSGAFFAVGNKMITCHVRYEIDPEKIADFEAYSEMWLALVPRFGGIHHGYFLPSEGASDVALAIFSFPSLADYERYRKDAAADPDVKKAMEFAKRTQCFRRYDRTFFRPLLPKAAR
jgi:antibiotic biosynthesis monooxygenase (ABM) superfamily enzyme